jgi:acetamidase/formamidase
MPKTGCDCSASGEGCASAWEAAFGTLRLAKAEADFVDTIPPSYTGGNIDNWRIGKGATMYYPVSVAGALLSAGDPHASQGDSELCGTAIECSMTGTFQLILHKKGGSFGHTARAAELSDA